MILTDNETKIDLLNNEAIATTIIGLLRAKPEQPVTIGVHGDWGAGKSSVLEMIEAGFEGQRDVLCLKFNGWRFQGFEDAKIALIEGIVTGLIEKRPTLTKAAPHCPACWSTLITSTGMRCPGCWWFCLSNLNISVISLLTINAKANHLYCLTDIRKNNICL